MFVMQVGRCNCLDEWIRILVSYANLAIHDSLGNPVAMRIKVIFFFQTPEMMSRGQLNLLPGATTGCCPPRHSSTVKDSIR